MKLRKLKGFKPLSASISAEQQWQQSLEEARRFVFENKIIPSYKSKSQKNDKVLGLWLDVQKRNFPSLAEKQAKQLLEIPGFKAPQSKSVGWNSKFLALQQHILTEGSLPPGRKDNRDFPTGKWMRRQFKSWEELTHEQQQKLSSLPGLTAAREQRQK